MKKNAIFSLVFLFFSTAHSEEKYDLSFFEDVGGVSIKDAAEFDKGNDVLPGEYSLTVYLNDKELPEQEITYRKISADKISAVFSCNNLKQWGVIIKRCYDDPRPLEDYIPETSMQLDQGENTLSITIPQKFLSITSENDTAPPEKWQDGINSAFTTYNLNYDDTRGMTRAKSLYGNFTNGINLAGFQFRNSGFMKKSDDSGMHYVSSTSYISHDVDALRSTAVAGDFFTSGDLFPSQNLRGVKLATSTDMLSNAQRTYAPVISGVAKSNATVIIKQNDLVIATRKVTPGPFALKDIPASSNAGDLEITVIEANGENQHFVQPYNSVNVLVPENVFRYSVYFGRNRSLSSSPQLLEANGLYGVSNAITLINGFQYANHYQNIAAGTGANIRWLGGIYATLNKSQSDFVQKKQGYVIKSGLTHSIGMTDSYLYFTAENKLSPDYSDFEDAVRASPKRDYKSRYALQLSQQLGVVNLTLNFTQQYGFKHETSREMGGSMVFGLRDMQFIANITHRYGDSSENSVSFNASIPLGKEDKYYVNYSQSHGTATDSRLSFSGSLLDDDSLNVDSGVSSTAGQKQYDSSLNWSASKGNLSAGWSQGGDSKELSIGLNGSVVAHHHGITFGQPLGLSNILVHTDRISGLHITDVNDVTTDYFGNAIVNNVSPYRYNETSLSSEGLNQQIEIDSNIYQTAPRAGAIVEVDTKARRVQIQYAHIYSSKGDPEPFGAQIYDADNQRVGIVSAGGLIALDILQHRWPYHASDSSTDAVCTIDLNGVNKKKHIWELQCR
ncbi:fimbrial biogenesis outer membrane usher protein [Enterobacter asburiae]|uniref:fimbria/pilus outer membrane usher protein n=1 Tax=Enterobacter asburiae TaxID=61645 RepID=UPI001CBF460D|nr:fimbria/pilus outer membrane usher protein [Enterobacter asburiae]EKS6735815.1 fimbrial biogenesis outer membrane usher protein [Enterobacter asburiae]MDW3568604.1 fimbrial biogenesis outer membrane usher protein [Enterobacter asburiae]UAN17133.1 fimbrial biogenesis outer membrane usher protein [Enterobacter asburiae]